MQQKNSRNAASSARLMQKIDYVEGARFKRDSIPLFSASFYAKTYPDYAETGLTPLDHYIEFGWRERRQPHILFDASWYLESYPDVDQAEQEPLLDYLERGWRYRRSPHLLFDVEYYLQNNPDIESAGAEPLDHYLTFGWREGRKPHLLFDPAFYLAQNLDVAAAGLEPLTHYLTDGWRGLRSPHPLFNVEFYLTHQRDVLGSGVEPLQHYLTHGWKEGRRPHSLFDPQFYQAQHPDLSGCPLIHYLEIGESENWRPNPYFSPLFYRNAQREISSAISPLVHFAVNGDKLGLQPSPEFDPGFYRASYLGFDADQAALSHFIVDGQYRGFKPLRPLRPSRRLADWLRWRSDFEKIGKLHTTGSKAGDEANSILWLLVGEFSDDLITQRLLNEIEVFVRENGGGKPLLRKMSSDATVNLAREALAEGAARWVCVLRPEVLISSGDLQRLWHSCEAAPESAGVAPLFVTPDLMCASLGDGEVLPSDWLDTKTLDANHPVANFRWTFESLDAPVLFLNVSKLKEVLKTKADQARFKVSCIPEVFFTGESGAVVLAPGAVARVTHGRKLAAKVSIPRTIKPAPRILYVDSTVPRPNMDAGSDTAWRVLNLMREMGFDVTFLPAVVADTDVGYIHQLQDIGVMVVYPPYVTDMRVFIEKSTLEYDIAFVARAPIAGHILNDLRKKWPNCKVIFNTVDLHYLRMQRAAIVNCDPPLFAQAVEMKETELNIIRRSEETIVLSEAEVTILREEGINSKITVIPPVYDVGREFPYLPEARNGVFFIGGFAHAPNVDAVDFLVSEIWPKVIAKRQDVVLHIAGSKMPARFRVFEGDNVKVVGFVSDVDVFMSDKRVMVSPLRYGAGVKVKVIASISAGVPSVVTPTSVEGAGLLEGEGYTVADSAEEIAEAILAIYDDLGRLASMSDKGKTAVRARYSVDANRQLYKTLLSLKHVEDALVQNS